MARKSKDVFLNCPFDAEYKPIFDALLFCICDCGFRPRSALEQADSGEVRVAKIIRLIRSCRFGVHDISRTEPDKVTELPRFNMPFGLGLFLGFKYSETKGQASKNCLVLDREPYRYQKFFSDIAGQDTQSHADLPPKAIQCVRDWLRTSSDRPDIPGSDEIVKRYKQFEKDLPSLCRKLKLSTSNLIYADLCLLISEWLKVQPFLDWYRTRLSHR